MTATSAKTIANGQTLAERTLGIQRLEAILQGMIIMLKDNPHIPLPWSVDISCKTDEAAFERIVVQHDLHTFGNEPSYAYLKNLADRYVAAEDQDGFYMPWTVQIDPEDRPL